MALAAFLLVHLANHIVGLTGKQAHITFMAAARAGYRNALVEPILLVLIGWQATSGLVMALRGWRSRQGWIAWVQAGSGLYLAGFLLVHVGAVLIGRRRGLDTNFDFAAAGFHVPTWPWFFAPYYFAAVTALFLHAGCALYWARLSRGERIARRPLLVAAAIGPVLAALIVLALSGALYVVTIPPAYLATYG